MVDIWLIEQARFWAKAMQQQYGKTGDNRSIFADHIATIDVSHETP